MIMTRGSGRRYSGYIDIDINYICARAIRCARLQLRLRHACARGYRSCYLGFLCACACAYESARSSEQIDLRVRIDIDRDIDIDIFTKNYITAL
jgi:hypothetical protein